MHTEILSTYLTKLLEESQTVFIYAEPEITDFTKLAPSCLVVCNDKTSVNIPLNNLEDLPTYIHMLEASIFEDNRKVICWNIKNLMTYIDFHIPFYTLLIRSAIVDLKIVESFSCIKLDRPNTLTEAVQRVKVVIKNEKLINIYKHIHKPLALRVLPSIESAGLVEVSGNHQRRVYPYYEIEGQVNGRLRCEQLFADCINSHVLTEERKSLLKTNDEDERFLVFDYSHMEVSMLQWLSSDPVLGEITQLGQDPYKKIFELIFDKPCTTDAHRKFAKDIFLPVVYGMQAHALGERHKIGVKGGNYILRAIRKNFSVAFDYLEKYQEKLKQNPIAEDRFGRQRRFDDDHYKVRNFIIQAPASMVCLEKLIALHDTIEGVAQIVLNIHDGYVIIVHKKNLEYIEKIAEDVLLAPSKLCPGINLQVKKSIGQRL